MGSEHDIVVERRVSAPPEKVFAYFTDAGKWLAWQGTEAEIELEPGGLWRVNVTGGGFASGRVLEVVENKRIVFTWGWEQGPPVPPGSTTVTIELVPEESGTLIRLTHTGLPSDQIEIHRQGWEHYVPRLVAVSDGRDPGPTERRDESMEVDVQTAIEIDRERSVVAAYASDPDNATTWYTNIKRVEWRSPKPLQLGSRIDFVAQFLGRSIAYTYEVKEMVPGERLVMATSEGPFAMETTYSWSDTSSGGTSMSLRNRGAPSGFSKVAAPMMKAAMRRANSKDLTRLKQILERDPAPG